MPPALADGSRRLSLSSLSCLLQRLKEFCDEKKNEPYYKMFIIMKIIGLIIYLLISLTLNISAQQNPRNWYVDQNHPSSNDKGRGTVKQPFKTISRAAELAGPGDSVIVMSGTYRERVAPARGGVEGSPVVYIAPQDQKVIIKGSEVWKPDWRSISGNQDIWEGTLDEEMFGDFNPFKVKARDLQGNRTLGQVFVDGKVYTEVYREDDLNTIPGTWMVFDSAKRLCIHFEHHVKHPSEHLVEITVRNRIFAPHLRGLAYIHVNGFIMLHCANQFPGTFYTRDRIRGDVQAGALGTRSGFHWVIENNVIRFANSLGIDCGTEGGYDLEGDQPRPEQYGYHIIRYNVISDNGTGGIAGAGARNTQILYNVIERNNSLGWTSPEVGGIKVHWFTDGLIEGNIVRDNDCHGIWLDNRCINSRVTRNVVINSRGSGIFYELADGYCLIDNNIVAFTRVGDGIYTHDASGAVVAHNLLYANEHFGVYMRVVSNRGGRDPEGGRRLVGTHDMRILNNVFIDNYRGPLSLPLESDRVYNNLADYNLYISGAQWHWEGLGYNRFVVNMGNGSLDEEGNLINEDSGDISGRKALVEAYIKVMNETGISVENRSDMDIWMQQPFLTFQEWQMLTCNDEHSLSIELGDAEIENGAVSKGMLNFAIGEMYFETRDEKSFLQLNCPPVDSMDLDFYGNKLGEDKILPGPFQNYFEEHNRFVLRPPVVHR